MKISEVHIKIFAAFLALVIGWWGYFDAFVDEIISSKIADAAKIYGSARFINGSISVIQSTQIGSVVASINAGEMLDPINDLIERFSSVMELSIASLFLQKLLISIFSGALFNTALSVAFVFFVFSKIYLSSLRFSYLASRLFTILVGVRFSMVCIGFLTFAVDNGFVRDFDQKSREEFSSLSSLFSQSQTSEVLDSAAFEDALNEVKIQIDELTQKVQQKTVEKEAAEAILESIPGSSWTDILGTTDATEAETKAQEKLDEISDQLNLLNAQMETKTDELSCLQNQAEGEPCGGFWSEVSAVFDQVRISELLAGVSGFVDGVISLMVSMIFSTIVIPLFCLFVVYRVFLRIFGVLVSFD